MHEGPDFPATLKTDAEKLKRARQLAEDHLRVTTKSAKFAAFQGMFSKTIIVQLESEECAVIQFRYEPLDPAPFHTARSLLGELVPQVELLEDAELQSCGISPVYLSYIPGDTWVEAPGRHEPNFNVKVMQSLGSVLAKSAIPGRSSDAISNHVIPKLQRILESTDSEVDPFRTTIQTQIDHAHNLAVLPLFFTHVDLNEMNIMVQSEGNISGIVDWELAPPPAPFGIGLVRILHLIGHFQGGVYYEHSNAKDLDAAFWQSLLANLAASTRTTIEKHWDEAQTAFAIGTIFDALSLDVGGTYNPVAVRALPHHLKYQMPPLRQNGLLFRDSE